MGGKYCRPEFARIDGRGLPKLMWPRDYTGLAQRRETQPRADRGPASIADSAQGNGYNIIMMVLAAASVVIALAQYVQSVAGG
ncbi:MAG TPA: hypothetical protein VHC49_15925 [Mycobacteriales bacterium]|nr:hypothetical protein [Mycobacteriales bacterium]